MREKPTRDFVFPGTVETNCMCACPWGADRRLLSTFAHTDSVMVSRQAKRLFGLRAIILVVGPGHPPKQFRRPGSPSFHIFRYIVTCAGDDTVSNQGAEVY